MRQNHCAQCGDTFPMNDTYQVVGRLLCESCANQEWSNRPGGMPPDDVIPQVDPTVCCKCQADHGDRELPRIVGLPVCPGCEYELRHRPFPAWVKIAFAALLALAVTSFVFNLRFFQGYIELRRVPRAMAKGDVARAAALMTSAAGHLPEVTELKAAAAFYQSLDLMSQDRSAEAVPLLKQCLAEMPGQSSERLFAANLLLRAEAGAAFDAKDYDTFLAKESELLKRDPNAPMAMAAVASAHACKYAVTGQESHKQEAMKYLDAATKDSGTPEAAEYRQRILHRLHTREVINKKEFDRRYPHGWKPEKTS